MIKTADIKKTEYMGIINFQYFVSGCFQGENLMIDIIPRKNRVTAINP